MFNKLDPIQLKVFLRDHGSAIPAENNGHFAVAVVPPKNNPTDLLVASLQKIQPNVRILTIEAPEGKDNLKQYRAFLSDVLYLLEGKPLAHGQESAAATWMAKLFSANYDYVIVTHAERLGAYSLDALRRDRGNPPVFLIAYDDQILETLLGSEVLVNRTFMLT
jgi:hypothetical protein